MTDLELAERTPAAADPQEQARESRAARIKPMGVLLVAALALGGVYYWFSGRNIENTDDAYTDGRAVIDRAAGVGRRGLARRHRQPVRPARASR